MLFKMEILKSILLNTSVRTENGRLLESFVHILVILFSHFKKRFICKMSLVLTIKNLKITDYALTFIHCELI